MINPLTQSDFDPVTANPHFEACVLSKRMIYAEMGEPWDWQGLTEDDFQRIDYRTVYQSCRKLETEGKEPTTPNVIAESGLPSTRIIHIHRVALHYDRLWALLTPFEYDFIKALKQVSARRRVLILAENIIEGVTHYEDPQPLIEELKLSPKYRKARARWK